MKLRKCLALPVLLLLSIVLQCSDNSTTPTGAELDQPFSLSSDQNIRLGLEALEVLFTRVISDTRCPAAGVCHAGDLAEISVRIVIEGKDKTDLILRIVSDPSADDIEALAVDTLGYRFRLLALSESTSSQASPSPVRTARIQISRSESTGGAQLDSLKILDLPVEQIERLPVRIDSLSVAGDTLIANINYSGGCGQHYFSLIMSPATIIGGQPLKANLYFRHNSGYEPCSGIVKRELRFLLTPLKSKLVAQFGAADLTQLLVSAYSGDEETNRQIAYYGTLPPSANHAPIVTAVEDQSVEVTKTLSLLVTASDPDQTVPTLTTGPLPENATFSDFGNGQGELIYSPLAPAVGNHVVEIIASDGIATDTEAIVIEVLPENLAPDIAAPDSVQIAEGDSLFLTISATDPNGTIPGIRLSRLPKNMTIDVPRDGTATIEFRPDYFQAGVFGLFIIASDLALEDSSLLIVRVLNTNRAPILTAPGLLYSWFDYQINASITAADPDSEAVSLTALNLPDNVTFVDNGSGRATLTAIADSTQFGVYDIRVIASDGDLADTARIELAVLGKYPAATFIPVPPQTVTEGETLRVWLETEYKYSPPYIGFVGDRYRYHGRIQLDFQSNGKALFTYVPRFLNADADTFKFIAVDRSWVDTIALIVNVLDAPNQAPNIGGGSRIQVAAVGQQFDLEVRASDPDASGPLTIVASGLPAGASFVSTGPGTSIFSFTPNSSDTGKYDVTFEVRDFVDPSLSNKHEMELFVNEFQQNLGPLVSLEIGRYWVYLSSYWQGCSGPYWAIELAGTATASSHIDSVEVVDSVRVDGVLKWILSPSIRPLGGAIRVRGDSLFLDSYNRYFFPVSQVTTISGGTAQPKSINVPEGAYLNGFSFWLSCGSQYYYQVVTFAAGVGIVQFSIYDGFSIMTCDNVGCCNSSESHLLIRTGRR